ncbi:MAG TPA: GNAT family N-acetyltransferase [Bryobacteraceae bacterium]|nr:GNAT family N-acetyltransferase [Bryobacteraceae bacterium]
MQVRPPQPGEWPACRMLLPKAFERGAPEVLLAFDTDRILGGAAFRSRGEQFGLIQFRIVRPFRRRGFGTQLMQSVLARARERGHTNAFLFADTLAEEAAGPFLASHGFERKSRIFVVEAETQPMLAEITRLRERLLKSGKVPPGARIVKPAEAPMDEVAKLYNEHIATGQRIRPEYLEASFSDRRFQESSLILMVDGRIAGFMMVEWVQGVAVVPARVVVPEYRGGFANILLLAAGLERAVAAGNQRTRFDSHETNRDTLKLAKKFHADTVKVLDSFVRGLAPEEQH